MGVIQALLGAEISQRKRLLKRQTSRKGQLAVAGWLTVTIFIRLIVNDLDSLNHIRDGSLKVGLALLEFDILHTMLVVFLFTFSLCALSTGSTIPEKTRLRLSAQPGWKLAVSGLLSRFVNAIGLNSLLFAIPVFIPFLFLGHPLFGVFSFWPGSC